MNNKSSFMSYIVVSVFSILFFISIYGIEILDFQNVDWLYGRYEVKENCFYGNDLTQHYLGWVCYRNSDWTFPIGNMDKFSYPYQTSVIYTDSIPLFALFFKILSPMLPEQFQYFGLWAILCFVLQGIMAVRLFKSYTKSPVKLVLAAAFFVIVPMLLWRTFIHSALCAHWIILMAMEPLVDKVRWDKKRLIIHYSLVGFFASMTAIYLLLFCGIVLIGTCVRDISETKKVVNSVLSLISFVGVAAVAIAIMGGFSGEFASSLGGLGEYSMNFNSFYDSYGLSSFIGEMPRYTAYGDRQFEGYGYLGLGIILLIVVSSTYIIIKKQLVKAISNNKYVLLGLAVSFCIALVYAVSPSVTFNNKLLFIIPLPEFIRNIWSIFRATGRGIWILVYIIIFLVLRVVISLKTKKIAYTVMAFCLLVQLLDGIKMYHTIFDYFHNPIIKCYGYEEMTNSIDFWEKLALNTSVEHIVFATTFYPYDDETTYYIDGVYCSEVGPTPEYLMMYQYLLGDFAIKNNKTFNYFRFSRHPYARSRRYVLDQLNEPNANDIYVFTDYNKMRGFASGLSMYKVDDIYIGSVTELDEKYRVSDAEKTNNYLFKFETDLDNRDDYFVLSEGKTINCFMMELPKGIYRFSVTSSNANNIDFSLAGDAVDNASLIWSNIESDRCISYYIFIEEDLYTSWVTIYNAGEDQVRLDNLEVEYIGTEDLLYE